MKQWQVISALSIMSIILVSGVIIAVTNLMQPSVPNSAPVRYIFSVVQAYPHDAGAFTEGLAYADGVLYESTGLYGSSSLRRVDLETGVILEETALPDQFFGEGITIIDNTIIQLTYMEHTGIIYDKTTFIQLSNFTYGTEGWGITFDGDRIIMSDGSNNLYFLDPVTHQNIGHVAVHDGNVSVGLLNELEYVKGDVYANIYTQQRIAVINPETGQVKAWIDLTGLGDDLNLDAGNVLNGIAYDEENDRFFVTGKNWPHLYEIKLIPVN